MVVPILAKRPDAGGPIAAGRIRTWDRAPESLHMPIFTHRHQSTTREMIAFFSKPDTNRIPVQVNLLLTPRVWEE